MSDNDAGRAALFFPAEGSDSATAGGATATRVSTGIRSKMRYTVTLDIADAHQKYANQSASAARRGIEWRFTFYEWLGLWIASGHWHERGAGSEHYCMARMGDAGPYAASNVYICTNKRNRDDYHHSASRQRCELLSDRELCVLDGVGRGESINDIAADLCLSPSAVSTYRRRVLQKLELETNADLQLYVSIFRRHALTKPPAQLLRNVIRRKDSESPEVARIRSDMRATT